MPGPRSAEIKLTEKVEKEKPISTSIAIESKIYYMNYFLVSYKKKCPHFKNTQN